MRVSHFGFVTGMGRSGTLSVSKLLLAGSTNAHHEHIGNRHFWLLSTYRGESYSRPYLRRVRAEIQAGTGQVDFPGSDTFIDVNGYLQNCASSLRDVFGPISIFHLVRDPREVVASLMARRDHSALNVIPEDESSIEWWLSATPFERVCWNWNDVTSRLLDQDTMLLRLEDLTGDFDYAHNFVNQLHGQLNVGDWEAWASTKPNKAKSRIIRLSRSVIRRRQLQAPPLRRYRTWSDQERDQFESICGETMRRVGYE